MKLTPPTTCGTASSLCGTPSSTSTCRCGLSKSSPGQESGPWLDDDSVREAMAARDQARSDRDLTPCEATEKEFRESRNAVKVAINRTSAAFYASAFRHSRPQTWKKVRQFLISSQKAQPRASGTAPTDPGWPDRLNRFFTSVGSGVANALAEGDVGAPLPPRPPRVCAGAFSPGPATLPELSAALQRMSSSRACGPDGITVHTAHWG